MANEPIYNVASFDCKNKLCSAQTVVETRLLPMGGVSISKVLSYCAEGHASAAEVFTGEARVSGKVNFRVLFLDGNGACRSMETSAEFTDKITDDAITGGRPEIIGRILDIDILSVAEGEMKLAAIVEMDLLDNTATRIKYLQGCGEDVFTHEEKVLVSKLAARVEDTFSVSDEIKAEGDKILLVESRVITLKRTAAEGSISVEGEIISDIVTEKENMLFSTRAVTRFTNESPADGSRSGFFADANARLVRATATLMVDEQSAAVSLEYDIGIHGFVYCDEEMSVIADAFSITNELSLTTAEIPATRNSACKTVFERIEGSVTLDNNMPIADKVLASVGARLNLANAYTANDKLVLEGTVTSSIVYFSAETGSKNSVDIELPFSITTADSMGGKIMSAYGEVVELSAKIRRGNEIDISAEIAANISATETTTVSVITDLSVGEKIEIPAAAVSLHIARSKETLWDIAKALKTTPELILLQNPDLTLPLSGGERVIVYRHLKKA